MENRTAEIAQAFESPAGGARGLLSLHQYELLFEMTTQLLAAQSLDEQVSLVLDTLTAGLELPLDSNAPHVRVVHDGRPAWLARDDEAAAEFLRQVGARTDVLALPLFGGQLHTD